VRIPLIEFRGLSPDDSSAFCPCRDDSAQY
jgi:hypothetical protein